jgi:NifU-like protein
MRLVDGSEGYVSKGAVVRLYLLVDETDGVIADARFQVFGPTILIGFAETICELIIRKNYDQAMRLSAEYVEKYLRDRNEQNPFPAETAGFLNAVLSALEEAVAKCYDIPLEDPTTTPLLDYQNLDETQSHPDFLNYSIDDKKAVLEKIIAVDIRPYIELDAGGVEIQEIRNGNQIIIKYEGACVSCYSATGATLESIQNILRAKVHPAIEVIPDTSLFQQN